MRGQWGDVVDRAAEVGLPGGAALQGDGVTWVLVEDQPSRGLGPALAVSSGADGELHVLVAAEAAPGLARRAELFDRRVTVWAVSGTALAEAAPAPLPAEPPLDFDPQPFVEQIEGAGADAVIEHGILRAEVRGLEVARVERLGAMSSEYGTERAQTWGVSIGVGKHDREAHHEVGGGDLFETVRIVAEHRVAGGEGHAAYHLSPERWLRSAIVRRPELVGAATLHPVPSPVVRDDLRTPAPAPAAGVDTEGGSVLVVCSVGIDVDLVPAAADAWLADGRKPRLLICVPEGDDHRVTKELVAALSIPAGIVTVGREWRT